MSRLELQPITLKEAKAWVRAFHRHHEPDTGALFAVGANYEGEILGVAVVGRPKARLLQDGYTCEVTRCCIVPELPTVEGHPLNVASKLYSACWRAARALGYQRMLTYTLKDETGTSLIASGWKVRNETKDGKSFASRGGSWSRRERPRVDTHPTQLKMRWEVGAWD